MEDGDETVTLPEQTGVETSGVEVAVTTVVILEAIEVSDILTGDSWGADIGTEVSIGVWVRSG